MKCLNVGCGVDYKKGWVNLDIDKTIKKDITFDLQSIYKGKKMPFKDRTFDYVYCADVLEHFSEPLPILRELYRVCKVDGLIEIKVPINSWVWDNMQHKRQFTRRSFDVNNFDEYNKQDKKVKLCYKKEYLLTSNNFILAMARALTGKTNLKVIYRKLQHG